MTNKHICSKANSKDKHHRWSKRTFLSNATFSNLVCFPFLPLLLFLQMQHLQTINITHKRTTPAPAAAAYKMSLLGPLLPELELFVAGVGAVVVVVMFGGVVDDMFPPGVGAAVVDDTLLPPAVAVGDNVFVPGVAVVDDVFVPGVAVGAAVVDAVGALVGAIDGTPDMPLGVGRAHKQKKKEREKGYQQ